jgi:hypothetical protein
MAKLREFTSKVGLDTAEASVEASDLRRNIRGQQCHKARVNGRFGLGWGFAQQQND